MRKFYVTVLALCLVSLTKAQPWTYDFGTLTASYSTTNQTSSVNCVMPFGPSINYLTPMSGYVTNYVRVGGGGGTINLENQAVSFGTGSYLRAVASSGSSLNMMKFAGMTPGTNQFYLSFKMRLGKSDGTSDPTITTGTWNLGIGNNHSSTTYAYYTSNSAPGNDALCSMQWSFGTGGAISFKAGGSAGTTTTYTGITFVQATDYTIEVFVNNSNQTTAYSKSSTNYAVTANSFDVWATPSGGSATRVISGTLPSNNTANSLNAVVDSWDFWGANNTTPSNNTANIF